MFSLVRTVFTVSTNGKLVSTDKLYVFNNINVFLMWKDRFTLLENQSANLIDYL